MPSSRTLALSLFLTLAPAFAQIEVQEKYDRGLSTRDGQPSQQILLNPDSAREDWIFLHHRLVSRGDKFFSVILADVFDSSLVPVSLTHFKWFGPSGQPALLQIGPDQDGDRSSPSANRIDEKIIQVKDRGITYVYEYGIIKKIITAKITLEIAMAQAGTMSEDVWVDQVSQPRRKWCSLVRTDAGRISSIQVGLSEYHFSYDDQFQVRSIVEARSHQPRSSIAFTYRAGLLATMSSEAKTWAYTWTPGNYTDRVRQPDIRPPALREDPNWTYHIEDLFLSRRFIAHRKDNSNETETWNLSTIHEI